MKLKYFFIFSIPLFCSVSLYSCIKNPVKSSPINNANDKRTNNTEKITTQTSTHKKEASVSEASTNFSTQENPSVSSIDPDTLPNKKMEWWIKREENHATPSAQDEVDLSRYDAWYVKTNLKNGEKPLF